MFNAQQEFDWMLFDFERNLLGERHANEVQSLEEQLASARAALRRAGLKCGRLQALLSVIEKTLSSYEPRHPILNDERLRDAVCEKGMDAFQSGATLHQVAQLAGGLAVPGVEGGVSFAALAKALVAANAQVTELKSNHAQLEGRYKGLLEDTVRHRAQRAAFRAELGRVAPNNPLVQDAGLRQRVSDAGLSAWAYTAALPDQRWKAVDLAGATFMLTYKPASHGASGLAGASQGTSGSSDGGAGVDDEVVPDDGGHSLDHGQDDWVPDGPEELVSVSPLGGPDDQQV